MPTFPRINSLLEDVDPLMTDFSTGKILPIELYLSEDRGFEYGTYVCLVDQEFLTIKAASIAWCALDYLPKKNSIIDFLNVKSGYFLNFALIIPKFEGKFPW